MPTVTANLFDQYRLGRFTGVDVDFTIGTDTIKCAIVKGSYTLDQNLHNFWDDISADEVSGTGYTAGGNQCTSITPTMDSAGLITNGWQRSVLLWPGWQGIHLD